MDRGADRIYGGGILIHPCPTPGGVVAAAEVEEAEEPEAFHRTKSRVEGGDAQAIESNGVMRGAVLMGKGCPFWQSWQLLL